MDRYGIWTTFDCPEEDKIDEALQFLKDRLEDIGGYVWLKSNPHDFGSYPSFEINKPYKFNDIDEDYSSDEELVEYDAYVDKMNELEREYNKKFFN